MAATARALLPGDTWDAGTNQNSIPANDNSLRAEVIARPALSFEAAQPSLTSPADDGNLYILSAAWGDEVANTLALFQAGAWSYWTPFNGMPKKVGPVFYEYDAGGDSWDSAYGSLGDYADDTAAASGGVVLDQLYRTGSALKVRIA